MFSVTVLTVQLTVNSPEEGSIWSRKLGIFADYALSYLIQVASRCTVLPLRNKSRREYIARHLGILFSIRSSLKVLISW